MKAKLMQGTYYEFVGRYLDTHEIVKQEGTSINEAKREACDTEKDLYLTRYTNGVLVNVTVLIGNPDGMDYPRAKGEIYYEELPPHEKMKYMLLSRLKYDCDYFLGNGNGYVGHLWAGSVDGQIKEMRDRWNAFADEDKPEWLTMEQIDDYERRMKYAEMR